MQVIKSIEEGGFIYGHGEVVKSNDGIRISFIGIRSF